MFEYHMTAIRQIQIVTLTQNAAGFAGAGGVSDGETPDSIRTFCLHHHGGGPRRVCPRLEVARSERLVMVFVQFEWLLKTRGISD